MVVVSVILIPHCRNCKDDLALYKAMNLSFLFDIHNDIINFTEVSRALCTVNLIMPFIKA